MATSIFGCPWICASTVHSLTHVKSLTDTVIEGGREKVTGVTETRWTPLVLNALIGYSIISLKPVLAQIPMCVLNGLFFYLGLSAMRGNEFIERVSMTLITDESKMPADHPLTNGERAVPLAALKKFTIMQIACLGIMWWVKGSPAAMLFPILIAALGPVRIFAGKSGWFTQEELNALDEELETDPGYGMALEAAILVKEEPAEEGPVDDTTEPTDDTTADTTEPTDDTTADSVSAATLA